MRPSRERLFAVGLLLLGGCMIQIDGTMHRDRLEQAIDATASEIGLHQSLLSSVDSLDGARGEVTRHESAMAARIHDVRLRLWDMSCSAFEADEMSSTLDRIAARESDYEAEMDALGELSGMRATCAQYSGELQGLLAQLRDRVDRSGCW
jgi:hypothetical protein